MKLKTWCCNNISGGLILSNLKRFWWVCALQSIILFLFLPLQMMMENIENLTRGSNYNHINLFYRNYGSFSNILYCAFPVVIATLIFSYMQRTKSATVIHGLPFSRNMLFANSILSGITLFSIPILFNGICIFIIKYTMEIGAYFTMGELGIWFINSLVLSFIIFALGVFVGMFTGSSIAQIVFTYIIHFLPLVIYALANELFRQMFFGYYSYDFPEFFRHFPMLVFSQNYQSDILMFFIIALALLALALVAYKKRSLENATEIVAFEVFKPIFKYGLAFCATITGYIYIGAIRNDLPNIAVALIWALVGYCIAEMLLKKSLSVWSSYKGLLICFAIIFAFSFITKWDLLGFEKRVPALESIASVEIGGFYDVPQNLIALKQSENITNARELQSDIIKNKSKIIANNKNHTYEGNYTNYTVSYKLKNGGKLQRQYLIPLNDFKDKIAPIYETEEFKLEAYPIFTQNAEDIRLIQLEKQRSSKTNSSTAISEKKKVEEFLNALRTDILNAKYADMSKTDAEHIITTEVYNKEISDLPTYQTETKPNVKHYSYQIPSAYKNTTKLLEDLD